MSDHERGCSGREYTCTCGHDDTITDTIETQAAEIEELRAQLKTVLDREAETHRRHDAKVEAQAAEIERLKVECQAQYHRGYYDGRAALGETE